VTEEARSRFEVVAQLAAGVSTNVYLCRLQGVAGFVKELAVKRLVPAYGNDAEAARGLMDEGWIAGQLNHANIVQVFEVGEEAGRPYLAMEYVRGVSLAQVTARMAGLQQLDLGLGVQLVTGIASAVAYTHQATDADGRPLGLVHRNVAPANVIISLSGMPKLLDFGLARDKGRLSPARAHDLFKGDLRYVAPEQISERPGDTGVVDQRADVFSLGVMLYELTCARNPFGPPGQSEREVRERIMSGGYLAPSAIVPGYPPELEHIVLWAMEPDLNQRCESAKVFFERLEALAVAHGDVANPPAWAAWLRELFPEMGNTPRPTLNMPWHTPTPGKPVAAGPAPSFANLRSRRTESNRSVPATTPGNVTEAPARSRTRAWALAALATGLVAAGVAVLIGRSQERLAGPSQDAQVVTPASAPLDAGALPADAGPKGTAPGRSIVAPDNDSARRPSQRSRSRKPAPQRKKTEPCS
jgi:serine/threonine protein kinase